MSQANNSTIIDLLRHGEPVGGRRYRGQVDDPLSDKGWQQMRAAVSAGDRWDVIYSSPLVRCAAFAEELAGRLDVPLQLDERLMEIGFGSWEGRTPDELRTADPDRLERFWRDPVGNRPAGAEPLDRFAARVSGVWRDMLAAHPARHILVVGHAGITRMITTLVLGIPVENLFRIQVENAGWTRFRVQGQGTDALSSLVFHGRNTVGG